MGSSRAHVGRRAADGVVWSVQFRLVSQRGAVCCLQLPPHVLLKLAMRETQENGRLESMLEVVVSDEYRAITERAEACARFRRGENPRACVRVMWPFAFVGERWG